jgi:hypothetical protein
MHDDQLQPFTEEAPAAGCSGSSSCNGKKLKNATQFLRKKS